MSFSRDPQTVFNAPVRGATAALAPRNRLPASNGRTLIPILLLFVVLVFSASGRVLLPEKPADRNRVLSALSGMFPSVPARCFQAEQQLMLFVLVLSYAGACVERLRRQDHGWMLLELAANPSSVAVSVLQQGERADFGNIRMDLVGRGHVGFTIASRNGIHIGVVRAGEMGCLDKVYAANGQAQLRVDFVVVLGHEFGHALGILRRMGDPFALLKSEAEAIVFENSVRISRFGKNTPLRILEYVPGFSGRPFCPIGAEPAN